MSKFERPPTILTEKEKERAAEKFIDGAARTSSFDAPKRKRGERKGVIYMRVPQTLIDDLQRIEQFTGYTPNMFCFHAIAEAVSEKLKKIERDID
jgi:hypothetical protein